MNGNSYTGTTTSLYWHGPWSQSAMVLVKISRKKAKWPILLTWFNFNPSMDK